MGLELHGDVASLWCLLGTWSGEGEGHYPSISPFRYREQVDFGHVGKPFLTYRQSTVRVDTGAGAHAEVGYLRGVGGGGVELVLAHPTGIAEVATGNPEPRPNGLVLRFESVTVACTPTAKDVRSVERVVTVSGDVLRYDLSMAAAGHPHQHHLAAELHRIAG